LIAEVNPMLRNTVVLLTFFLFIQGVSAQTDTILNRYKHYLLATPNVAVNINELATSLNNNAQWSDINYQDKEKGAWKPSIHLRRVRDLALAWADPASAFYQQPSILETALKALDHWIEKRYKSTNWWHNEIGVPQLMRDIIVLLQPAMSPNQRQGALEVLAQYKANTNLTGANLTWSADLGLHYGALTGNLELIKKYRDLLINEIKITTEDGVQPDYSFQQHGNRLQMYQYGGAFLIENVRLAWELRGTVVAFPKKKIDLLTDFVLLGWQWMARGIHTVPGTMDRSASRKNAMHAADIRPLIPYLVDLIPEKSAELNCIASHQNNNGALNGFRYFPYSDFAVYHNNDFSFFVKTISTRTLATESINSENLKGKLLNSGDAYFIHDGEQYFNLMPAWNWQFLPGITSFNSADHIERQPFAGSVGDGKQGFTSMDYVLADKSGAAWITAKKSWFCQGNTVVSLIADLKGVNVDTAYTAMDQARWRGPVTVNKSSNKLEEGDHVFECMKWLHHSNFLYVPLGNMKSEVRLQTVTEKWSSINASESDELLKEKTFLPLLVHNKLSTPTSFGYLTAFCKTPAEAKRFAKKATYKIISNDSSCQAVSFPDGTYMFAFFQPSSIVFKRGRLVVDKPCLLMLKGDKLYASDPLQVNAFLTVQLNNKTLQFQLPEHGFSTKGLLLK
jgi:chondroitin AC lyase